MNNFEMGDPVEVELVQHNRVKQPDGTFANRPTQWKPAIFWKYEGKSLWVTVKTPAGEAKRSFPETKVRKI